MLRTKKKWTKKLHPGLWIETIGSKNEIIADKPKGYQHLQKTPSQLVQTT